MQMQRRPGHRWYKTPPPFNPCVEERLTSAPQRACSRTVCICRASGGRMQLEWALCTEERVFVAHSSVFRLEFSDKRPSQGRLECVL